MTDLSALSPILMTGATTGTGRRLALRLLEKGATLRCLVHTPGNRSVLPRHAGLEVVFGSADNREDLENALNGVKAVVHLAGHGFTPLLIETMAGQAVPRRLVVQSSTRLLSKFPTPVRESVRKAELAVQNAPEFISWTIPRPSMIFGGPEDRNIERFARLLGRSRFFPVFGSGNNLVQPVFVRDLVEAHLACLETPAAAGKIYNLAGPEAVTFRHLIRSLAAASGAKPPVFIPFPLRASLLAARLLKKIWPRSPLPPEAVERFGEDKAFDISPARQDLGFNPTPLETALEIKFRRQA